MNEWLSNNLVKAMGTMACFYLFCLIGIGSIVGYMTGNATLALLCGAVSSYFIQLVSLPLILVSQNKHHKNTSKILAHHDNHSKKLDEILSKIDSKGK